MTALRRIRKVIGARLTIEGAGVRLKRAFGFQNVPELDPFLLLDDFHSDIPADYLAGFPWHPHRGIETITYVLTGTVEHGDSMGNGGVIGEGELQWMTAGSGVIHQEMPKGDHSGRLQGFQLWANLPARQKMMDPRYRGIGAQEVPAARVGAGTVRVIAGRAGGIEGPVRGIVTGPAYLDVSVPPSSPFSLPVEAGHTAFAYVFEGSGFFDPGRDPFSFPAEGRNYFDLERTAEIGPERVVLYGDGDRVEVQAGERGVRFLLISGRPLGEPVAWHGPIVMNTEEELRTAFEEYRNGTFIRYHGPGR
jgi:redox-sensitive bicupin YhaK (pirin superfamily)